MNAPVAAARKSERSESSNTPECRGAYLFLHTKRTKNAAKVLLKTPRNDGTFLFPKLSTDPGSCPNYMYLYGHVLEAARKMWPGNVDPASGQWVWPAGADFPIKDGDVPLVSKPKPGVVPKTAEQLAESNKWRRGYWVIEATNYLEAGPKVTAIVNGQMVELPAQTINGKEMYKSGDFCIVHLHAWTYENERFGVNFGLEGICFTKPGEKIGNGGQRSAAQMFGNIAPMATHPMAYVPGAQPVAAPGATLPGAPMPGQMPGMSPQSYAPPAAPAASPAAPPQSYAPPAAPVVAAPPPPPMPGGAPMPPSLPPMPGMPPR